MITFVRRTMGLPESADIEVSPLGGRGSDRVFFRMKWPGQRSVILVHYDAKRLENAYYADLGLFLRSVGVRAPSIFGHDPDGHQIVMEDLGDTDLWALRQLPWESRQPLYQETLVLVHRLHSLAEKDFPTGRIKLMDGFGPDLYRWERDYFREHFVSRFCGIELEAAFAGELEEELSALSDRLYHGFNCLVHRDLQSQNVMIHDGKPFLIDFQGMRAGSPFYDLGSLLCDPYVGFSDFERDELLFFYYDLSKRDFDRIAFRTCFWEASAQRLMQALGAYGFLGITKGLQPFLDHIPAGLRNLSLAASRVLTLPYLRELCEMCRHVIETR